MPFNDPITRQEDCIEESCMAFCFDPSQYISNNYDLRPLKTSYSLIENNFSKEFSKSSHNSLQPTETSQESKSLTFTFDYCDKIVKFYGNGYSASLNFANYKHFTESYQKFREVFSRYDDNKKGKIYCFNLKDALLANGSFHSDTRTQELCVEYMDEEGCIFFSEFVMCTIESLKANGSIDIGKNNVRC